MRSKLSTSPDSRNRLWAQANSMYRLCLRTSNLTIREINLMAHQIKSNSRRLPQQNPMRCEGIMVVVVGISWPCKRVTACTFCIYSSEYNRYVVYLHCCRGSIMGNCVTAQEAFVTWLCVSLPKRFRVNKRPIRLTRPQSIVMPKKGAFIQSEIYHSI